MVDYFTILPDALQQLPVPAELKRFRIPYFVVTYLENRTCHILRQTWMDRLADYSLQFTRFDILSTCHIKAVAADPPIAAGIIYILEGSFSIRERADGESLSRMEGSLYLRKVNDRKDGFYLDFNRSGIYQVFYLCLSESRLGQLQQGNDIFRNRDLLRARDIMGAGPRIKSLVEEMQNRREPDRAKLGRYFVRRIQRLYDAFVDLYDGRAINWRAMRPEERIDHLKRYIQNNLGENLTLRALAEMLHMDKDALRKLFHEKTGQPISRYIQEARIRQACTLLENYPQRSAERIAEEVGYNSLDGFYNAFTKLTGYSPKQYAKRQKG